jgi:hypothetical protein
MLMLVGQGGGDQCLRINALSERRRVSAGIPMIPLICDRGKPLQLGARNGGELQRVVWL